MASIEELRQIVATFTPEQRVAFEQTLKAKGVVLPDLSDPTPKNPVVGAGEAALSTLGKIGDALDVGENLIMSAARPAVEAVFPNAKEAYAKKGMNVVPSDIIDAQFKELPGPLKFAAGFLADIALDPLTYTGIGVVTKTGKTLQVAKSAAKAGITIKPSSQIGKEIAALSGKKTATKKMIEKASVMFAPSLEEQARMGQRALIAFGNPFTGTRDFTLVRGAAILGRMEQFGKAVKGTGIMKKATELISTSTGNKEFDAFREGMVDLTRFRLFKAKENATEYAKKIEEFSKKYDLDKEELDRIVTSLAENKFYGDLTAKEVLEKNAAILHRSLTIDKRPIEKVLFGLPDFVNLPAAERARLLRDVTKEVTRDHAGYNVYTTALRQLPVEIRENMVREFFRQSHIKLPKKMSPTVQYADIGKVYSKVLTHGEDAALLELVGQKEYDRLIKNHQQMRTSVSSRNLNFKTEYDFALHNLRELVSHSNQMFGITYNLWKSNPKYVESSMSNLADLMKRMDSNPAWKVQALVDQFQIPLKYAKKYPALFDLAQQVRRWGQEQLQKELDAGVRTKKGVWDIGYVAHVPSKAVREWLEKNGGDTFRGSAREWTTKHQSQLVRSLQSIDEGKVNAARAAGLLNDRQVKALLNRASGRGLKLLDKYVDMGILSEDAARNMVHTLTVDEVNNLAKAGQLRLLGKQAFDTFFEESPAEIIRVRGMRGARAITGAEFLEGSKQFGTLVPDLKMPPPPGHSYVKAPELRGYAFEHDVAKHIDKYYESIKLPTAVHPFLQAYDNFQDGWKAWTLSVFPSYHLRNMVGNFYNNFLAGMGPESTWAYNDARKIQRGAKYTLETATGQKYTKEQLLHLANRYGILDTGSFYGDIEKYFEIEAKGIGKLARNAVIDKGLKIGGNIENNAKLAHFLWQLKQGVSPVDASMSVKKYLFDYRKLSDTEKQVFRRVLPFYTWTRNNVPLQLQALVTRPGKVGGVNKIKNSMETDLDGTPDERLLPDWMVQNYPIRIRKNNQTGDHEYFLMGSWLPSADIDKIFDPVRTLKNMLGPLIKEPIQQLSNKDFFTDREIDSGEEYQRLLGANLPARVTHAAKNIRAFNELDKFVFQDDTDFYGRMMRVLSSRLYPVDEETARKGKSFEFDKKERNLKRLLNRARNRGDDEEEARLMKRIEALKEKRSEVIR